MLAALYSGHAAFWIHKLYLKNKLAWPVSPFGHWIHPASFRWLKTDAFATAFMRQPPQFVWWSKLWEMKQYNYPQPSKSAMVSGAYWTHVRFVPALWHKRSFAGTLVTDEILNQMSQQCELQTKHFGKRDQPLHCVVPSCSEVFWPSLASSLLNM